MNFLDNELALHERALRLRSQRLELLSANIANADTPHFKARDIDFRAAMAQAGEGLQPAPVKYRVPFNTAFDGNTVELSVEQAAFGRAAAEFQATLGFLESRFSGLRKALKGE